MQYEDGPVYDLIEIVITHEYQGKGAGTAFMAELEKRVQEKGAFPGQHAKKVPDMGNAFLDIFPDKALIPDDRHIAFHGEIRDRAQNKFAIGKRSSPCYFRNKCQTKLFNQEPP